MSESKSEDLLANPQELMTLAEQAVELARRAGADFVDVSTSFSRGLSIVVDNSSIKTAETNIGRQVSIRAYVAGGMGYVTCGEVADSTHLKTLAEKSVTLAKLATSDPDFRSLPMPGVAAGEPETFDPRVAEVRPEELIRCCVDGIESAKAVSEHIVVSGDASVSASSSAFASSTGIRIVRKGTNISTGLFIVSRDPADRDNVGSFADYTYGRFYDDFHPVGLGDKVARRAMEYQNAKKMDTRKVTLIVGPMSAGGLFSAIASAASGESIRRKRSILADRMGQAIASPIVSVTDNGLISRGVYSGAYDAEGAARKIVPIVREGVFTAALHNSYTANLAGVANTGHGQRTGGVGHTNLEMPLGTKTAAELIAETDDGVYLELGGLNPDLTSGDISTNLDFAFRIEKGKLTYPLANAMVGGNLIDVLKSIDAVSSDYREIPGNRVPTIRISNVQISSGGE